VADGEAAGVSAAAALPAITESARTVTVTAVSAVGGGRMTNIMPWVCGCC
jgi:hypothetical protein